MPLGLAKDSMLNLAELASKTEDELFANGSSRDEDTDGTSDKKDKASKDNDEKELHKSSNEADNDGVDNSMLEAVQAPIHSNLTADVTDGRGSVSTSLYESKNDTAAKTQKQDSKIQKNTHQYAGFQADYYDFEAYTSYNFPGDGTMSYSVGDKNNGDKNPWWQCIFPWITSESDHFDKEDDSGTENLTGNDEVPNTKTLRNDNIDDDISMISAGSDNFLGDGLLQRNQLAETDGIQYDGAGDDSVNGNNSTTKKGIILKSTLRSRDYRTQSTRTNNSIGSNSSKQSERRSLFPAYEPKNTVKKNLHASFSPMARVVTIKSSKEMDDEEKSLIWWQRADYDEFRKTGRMISKVMLQGGSEIWLATNQSWQLPNQGKAATLRRAMANIDNEDASDKWWHKFGHSRRGLEHIASIDEGRQRQMNVKTSIRAILTEQRRQKAFHREDPDKLRMCSIQNTSWAKDLALASGASDADAVSKNFDDESRKSREFYLLKFSRAGKLNSTSSARRGSKQVVPAFMKPMISMQLQPNRLDANTTSRLKFKKKEDDKRVNINLSAARAGSFSSKPVRRVPIHDRADNLPGKESLASKAAGFANGEEAVNMSAVLTGMGPIPKNSNAGRSRPVLA
eukprot:CAMPEP_0116128156 /NCGR_PEP_ID=MMETSP0329-20121206/7211_1 /TAXON_ID=697910 /ORGANISM="Pseudo-nitzschia arenysensis, Strain B593" /LENGTH=623 /DNA_ID=CAMNT_0003622279 /DNA_START=223 /DNA_END=2094 /DNA_ORIENTATION=+